jgi:hypothetical protein
MLGSVLESLLLQFSGPSGSPQPTSVGCSRTMPIIDSWVYEYRNSEAFWNHCSSNSRDPPGPRNPHQFARIRTVPIVDSWVYDYSSAAVWNHSHCRRNRGKEASPPPLTDGSTLIHTRQLDAPHCWYVAVLGLLTLFSTLLLVLVLVLLVRFLGTFLR